ncbi:MAG: hypothetical protein GY703_10695 [Gammaproteobacteria bacterium]|nr:hypothetical protein [Gammaproteobacteria bacterium]
MSAPAPVRKIREVNHEAQSGSGRQAGAPLPSKARVHLPPEIIAGQLRTSLPDTGVDNGRILNAFDSYGALKRQEERERLGQLLGVDEYA